MMTRRNFIKNITHSSFLLPFLNPISQLSWVGNDEADLPQNHPFIPPQHSTTSNKKLTFYNTHTGEWLKNCTFFEGGKFITENIKSISHLFRDHRQNKIRSIDQNLIMLLFDVCHKLETQKPIHLISGFRSPETNLALHINSYGVAKHSQHTLGKAADIFIEGKSLKDIQKSAISLKRGGVGRYERFVHIDTGRVRNWGLV